MDYTTSKNDFRRELLLLRAGLSASARREKSLRISRHLVLMDRFQSAESVQVYLSQTGEVETDFLIQETIRLKKRVVVPVLAASGKALEFSTLSNLDPNFLEIGPFGIRQPRPAFQKKIPAHLIDLWLLPGLGFDLQGNRLGYGLGYYDRVLQQIDIMRIGLAFDLQVVEQLPVEATDRPVSKIVTETRTIQCREAKCDRSAD